MEIALNFVLIINILIIMMMLSNGLTATVCKITKNIEKKSQEICVTPGCLQAAKTILSNINSSIDPCDDFHQFACGGFLQKYPIPEDSDEVSNYMFINIRNQHKLKNSLETISEEPRAFLLLKRLYDNCMDTKTIEETGLNTIKGIMKDLGGWPVLEGSRWKEDQFEWMDSVYKCRKLGLNINYFLSFTVDVDPKNNSRRFVTLDQPKLGLENVYLTRGLDDTIVKAYYDYMVNAAVIMGANRDFAATELLNSLQFEIKLSNVSQSQEARKRTFSDSDNLVTIRELQNNYPSIPWKKYINALLKKTTTKVSDEDKVIVNAPEYIRNLENLLRNFSKRIQANYLMWRVLEDAVPYLTENLNEEKFRFDKVQRGVKQRGMRWNKCIQNLNDMIPIATGALYVRNYFSAHSKQLIFEIMSNILTTFTNILKDIDWMDEKTRKSALEKAHAIYPHVGYAEELLDNDKLDTYYSKLNLNSNNYLISALDITLFNIDKEFGKLREPVNRTEWTKYASSATVNAFYNPSDNSIEFPAGILQGTFFDENRPHYLNYGSIGYVIGHEITHGFDNNGRNYDKDGNLINWWDDRTNETFVKKAQCLIDEYNNLTFPNIGMHVNGANTLAENIADNGGIKEAYLAYQSWVEDNGHEPQLPGLNYTSHQLFWIAAAMNYCSNIREVPLKNQILTDEHSPMILRTYIPLSNTNYFAKDFNCPLGSTMNPKHKCSVW